LTRAGSTVGAGLAAARVARPIRAGERIHVVGAGGAGASAAALLGRHAGGGVSACDAAGASPYTVALTAAGIDLASRHDAAHVQRPPHPERLAVTKALTAIDPDHPELVAARGLGIPLEPWQQVVADAAAGRRLVGVAGTHGKSTTAGWLVHLLVAAGADPSAFVGALLPPAITGGPAATARWGRGAAFVVEADEYAGNFDAYRPSVAVVTSAEWDHPDVFSDQEAVVATFENWLRRAADGSADSPGGGPVLVANVADPGVRDLVGRLGDWPGRIVATALIPADDPGSAAAIESASGITGGTAGGTGVIGTIVAAEPDCTVLEVAGLEPGVFERHTVRLPTAGRHNAANALGVAGAALELGVPADRIVSGLASFGGVGRRLERKGEANGVVVYDDYGHHPTAIRETLAAVRQREPGRPVWAVYEPLTYHRTAALLDAFAEVLSEADAVAVAEIWPGRDPDVTLTSAVALADAVSRRRPSIPVGAPGSVEATALWLAHEVRPGDAVLVMGGGRSYRIAELLLDHLGSR
jgi:UDP-N-acetylmuramate--alanine ligase